MPHNAKRIEILRIDNEKNQFYANIHGDNGESLFDNSKQGYENKRDLIKMCQKYFSTFPIVDKTIEEKPTKEIEAPADNPEEFLDESSHGGDEAKGD